MVVGRGEQTPQQEGQYSSELVNPGILRQDNGLVSKATSNYA